MIIPKEKETYLKNNNKLLNNYPKKGLTKIKTKEI